MRRILTCCLALALLLGAAGCTSRGEKSESTPTPTPTGGIKPTDPPAQSPEPTPTTEPTEEPEPAYRSFFNGAGLDEPCYDRPFAVMINNLSAAQPQCGIKDADIIYEVLAEGGVTRMMAIFSDIRSVENLGSIRSIRPYFLHIALSYGAVAIHAGGSEAAYGRIANERIQNIDGVRGSYKVPSVFHRDQQRIWDGYAVEHTLFTDGQKLYDCAESLNYPLTVASDYDSGLRFVKDGTPDGGKSAQRAEVTFGIGKSTNLNYHADSGMYTAVQYGSDYADGNTKEPVEFRNVLAIYAKTSVLDDYGRLSVGLIGSGRGYFACGGQFVEITWERESLNKPCRYYLSDGTELELGVGSTYICVLAEGQSKILFD